MLLNCIRQKSVTSWRSAYPADILSMPFSEEACERCKQRAQENDGGRKNGSSRRTSMSGGGGGICPLAKPPPHMDSLIVRERKDPVVPSPPQPSPCPFPSSAAAALPPKPQSPQPAQPPTAPHLRPFYGEPLGPLNGWPDPSSGEMSQPPRPARNNQLRTPGGGGEDGDEAAAMEWARGGGGGHPRPPISPPVCCVVFLEHQGETKRSTLPSNLHTVEQLKSLFLRSFPGLSPGQLQSGSVKVYIQKPNAPHGLFYQLEDVHDLEDNSVLRLFEQSPPSPAAPPTILQQAAGFGPLNDWSGHSSDSSSCSAGGQYPKSGSSTPIREDREETRRKVDSLERQLASLCSLVHSALLPRRDSTISVELAQLRAQIVDQEPIKHVVPMVESTTSTLSTGSGVFYDGSRRANSMGQVLSDLGTMKAELEELKREAQRSAFVGHEMIQRALEEVKGEGRGRGATSRLNGAKHLERLASVQSALRSFEANLENTRSAVLNSTRRLKLDEVDELAERLGEIGRETVVLKVEIPALQRSLEAEMRQTVERLAEEERMLREKLPLVDASLRRCKTLANMMVTMKKLAIIQDEERPAPAGPPPHFQQRRTIPVRHISLRNCAPATMAAGQQQSAESHPLDAILDELNANTRGAAGANEQQQIGGGGTNQQISASFTLRLGAPHQQPKGGGDGFW